MKPMVKTQRKKGKVDAWPSGSKAMQFLFACSNLQVKLDAITDSIVLQCELILEWSFALSFE
jgi:hypothetical protein